MFRVTPELHEAIKARADNLGVSMQTFITETLSKELDVPIPTKKPKDLLVPALKVVLETAQKLKVKGREISAIEAYLKGLS